MSLALARSGGEIAPRSPDALHCVVIDDSMIDRYLISHAVAEAMEPADIVEFATLEEGRSYLRRNGADVVLVDRLLPDGDGSDLAAEMPDGARMILVSGEDCGDLAERLSATGGFLHKDDLSADRIALMLREPPEVLEGEVITPHGPGDRPVFLEAVSISPLARGLRLIRTVRSLHDRAGPDATAELLTEIETVLVDMDRRGRV